MVILDFSKAFDTVHHSELLHKLSIYGIGENLHCWLRNFLPKRKMKVVVEGDESAELRIDSGVLQGTMLGPTLFLCQINDLSYAAKSQVRLFADDYLLYRPITS